MQKLQTLGDFLRFEQNCIFNSVPGHLFFSCFVGDVIFQLESGIVKLEIQNADKNADVETEKLFPQSQELSPENADVETETTMERGVSQERGESGERAKERTSERERERGEERERRRDRERDSRRAQRERERNKLTETDTTTDQ